MESRANATTADVPAVGRKVCWVQSPQFLCRLVFEQSGIGIWTVARAGPSLDHLVGREHGYVKRYLEDNGCTWEWKNDL